MGRYFEFETSLRYIEPRIWRRFLMAERMTFLDLHRAIQAAGLWDDYHLFAFFEKNPGRKVIADGTPLDEEPLDDAPYAGRVRLSSCFKRKGTKCLYVYDFGDSWEIDIELKQFSEMDETCKQRLLDGERAFPPEDCGGIYGYHECLAAIGVLKDPSYDEEQLDERRAWLGAWNSEDFDIEKVKKEFDLPKRRKKKTT